jgi:multidrug resistance efflux pump
LLTDGPAPTTVRCAGIGFLLADTRDADQEPGHRRGDTVVLLMSNASRSNARCWDSIFLIGLRFATPMATDARMIQHTIQLIPRLQGPSIVQAVLVEPNVPVKQGQPLIQFDPTPAEAKVRKLTAQLAAAKQNVLVMEADVAAAAAEVALLKDQLDYALYQQKITAELVKKGAERREDLEKRDTQVATAKAALAKGKADEQVARLTYQSEIDGVNTTVAATQAELEEAQYFLDNTLLKAPEDGHVMNLQVRAGMVAGDFRAGAIASFVCDADRYLLGNFFQEHLKFVKPGQPVGAALDLYPGQIFPGKVLAIWPGSGAGQMLPSGNLPNFEPEPADVPQGQFAVAIRLDDPDQSRFPIGTQGRAAIYTNPGGGFAILRRIGLRAYSWFNWIYPFSG